MIPYTATEQSITVVVDNRLRQVAAGSINFDKVKEVLRAYSTGVWTEETALGHLRALVDIPAFIATVSEGRVQINDTQVMYDGAPIHGHAAERLLAMLKDGFNPRPLMKFLDRLHQNPVVTARDELLHWLEHSKLPLTQDGRFVAYKFVNANFKDAHSNTIDNSVGAKIPKLDWANVNTNRGQTCAESGYHFCSFDYLGGGNPHVMLVLIAPEDVSSFPYDSEIAKGRCIFYEVIGEVPQSELGARMVEKTPVYGGLHSSPDADYGSEDDDEPDYGNTGDEEAEGDGYSPAAAATAHEAAMGFAATAHEAAMGFAAAAEATPRKSNRQSWIDRLKGIEHGGRKLTPARLRTLVKKEGQREAMRLTGIPRSTLQGWLKSQEKQ